MTEPRWYALHVKARKEKAAAQELTRRGFEIYLPSVVERRVWSDRVKPVELALFPGYLFVHTVMSPAQRVQLLKPTHTYDLVGRIPGDERVAQAIPDTEIESLKTLLAAERHLDPVDRLVEGTRVTVVSGPLQGTSGVVEKAPDGQRRLVAQIHLLGRGVRTVLSADDVLAEPGGAS
jgi:transcription antitermination factor NusG